MHRGRPRDAKPVRVRLERGHVNAFAAGEDKIDMRTVEDKSSRPLLRSPLQEMRGSERIGGRIEHGEERAHGAVGVDIVRAVKRVDRDEQSSVRIEHDRVLPLFRQHRPDAGALQPIHESFVGKDVERRLGDAVVSRADLGVHSSGEGAAADPIGDRESSARDRAQNPR